jgi:hypothetical protein
LHTKKFGIVLLVDLWILMMEVKTMSDIHWEMRAWRQHLRESREAEEKKEE